MNLKLILIVNQLEINFLNSLLCLKHKINLKTFCTLSRKLLSNFDDNQNQRQNITI